MRWIGMIHTETDSWSQDRKDLKDKANTLIIKPEPESSFPDILSRWKLKQGMFGQSHPRLYSQGGRWTDRHPQCRVALAFTTAVTTRMQAGVLCTLSPFKDSETPATPPRTPSSQPFSFFLKAVPIWNPRYIGVLQGSILACWGSP